MKLKRVLDLVIWVSESGVAETSSLLEYYVFWCLRNVRNCTSRRGFTSQKAWIFPFWNMCRVLRNSQTAVLGASAVGWNSWRSFTDKGQSLSLPVPLATQHVRMLLHFGWCDRSGRILPCQPETIFRLLLLTGMEGMKKMQVAEPHLNFYSSTALSHLNGSLCRRYSRLFYKQGWVAGEIYFVASLLFRIPGRGSIDIIDNKKNTLKGNEMTESCDAVILVTFQTGVCNL